MTDVPKDKDTALPEINPPRHRAINDQLQFNTGGFVTAVKLVDAVTLAPRRWTTIPTSVWPTGGSSSGWS